MRLLISGYYGAGNLGDEALLAGLLPALVDGGVDPVVASLDPAATTRTHGVAAVHRIHGMPSALWRADAVLSGGGGLLQDRTSERSLVYYLAVVRAARALGKPVAVFGQSLGPLSERGARRARSALRGVPLGLRDAPSLELARRLGLPARPVADPALLLRPPAAAGAAAGALVLVPRAGHAAIGTVLAELGRRHLAAGGRVHIALVHPAHDREEANRLTDALPRAHRVAAESAADLVGTMVGAHAVVSGRLHGLVLGAVAGAPVAGLAYDPKVRGFAESVHAPVYDDPEASGAAGVATVVEALSRFVEAPWRDGAAVTRATSLAADGVRWLLQEALHPRSRHDPYTGA